GDPERSPLRAAELLAADHLAAQRASFRPGRATPSASLAAPRNGREASSTTHLSVIDAEGGAVALTTTLNGLYGCKLYVPGAGFFLNNEMDDFTTAPGRPNQFGLLQGAANEVAHGRRMLPALSHP